MARNRVSNNRRSNNQMVLRTRRVPRVTSQGSSAITTRTLRRVLTLDMLDANGNDNYGSFNISDSITEYAGSGNLADLFDQYQIRKCRVYTAAYNSSPLVPTQVIADMATTKIYSCLDYDTDAALSFDEFISRRGLRTDCLTAHWQLVKGFVPRFHRTSPIVTDHQSTINPRVTWYNTSSPAGGHATFNGLKMYVKNYGGEPAHDTQTTYQKIKVMVEIDVALRGNKLV